MAITNFIPTVWGAAILAPLQTRSVAAGITNRNYEGNIRGGGDTVKITNVTAPTINTYTNHTDITVEQVADGTQALTIDQQKYFAFELDDVEAAQSVSGGALMADASQQAAFGLKNTQDVWLLNLLYSGAGTTVGSDDTDVSLDGAAYELLVDMAVALDESDVPEEGRWAVVTPAFHGLLLKDQRFISAGDDRASASRANGRVGEAAGLSIHKSNNLPAGGGTLTAGKGIVAGYNGAATLAEQIVSVEAARMEKRFADMVKGLHVYGAKVVRPTGLVKADVAV